MNGTAPQQPVDQNPVTPAVRTKVRDLLDRHFDDSLGQYIDGYSDEVVARETTASPSTVKRIREAAYGELRGDPELDGLRMLGVKLRAEVEAFETRLKALEQRLGVRR